VDGVAVPDPDAEEDLKIGAGCGCTTGAPAGPWLLAPLMLLGLRRRR
jgi:MYXO-CTERM domain-containing protein